MFWRKRKQSDFVAEIEAHLELETEQLKEQGLSEEAARAAARRAFGNVTRAQERFYESGRDPLNVAPALRFISDQPGPFRGRQIPGALGEAGLLLLLRKLIKGGCFAPLQRLRKKPMGRGRSRDSDPRRGSI